MNINRSSSEKWYSDQFCKIRKKSSVSEWSPRAHIFIKKRLQHECFPVNFVKLHNMFFVEHFRATATVSRHILAFSKNEMLFWKSLRQKCPNKEFFLVRFFLYSDWIQENNDQKKLHIRIFLFHIFQHSTWIRKFIGNYWRCNYCQSSYQGNCISNKLCIMNFFAHYHWMHWKELNLRKF